MKKHANGADDHYTVGQLAGLAGVSARALRHYEDEGLLVPRRSTNGYRTYSRQDARRLAQIMAMRACGLPLATIRDLLAQPNGSVKVTLDQHLLKLRAQKESLEVAMRRTQAAIDAIERMESMSEHQAFETMKAQAIQENEAKYGEEARERHGAEAVDAANERLMGLSQEEWSSKEQLEGAIKQQLRAAMASGDPHGAKAAELAAMHARWIQLQWGEGRYSREAHLGLAQGYLADPRFQKYYDSAAGEGATEFLVQALRANI